MTRARSQDRRGILNPQADRFSLSRVAPAADLSAFVDHHWLVRWDLRGRPPYRSELLPHPSVHLVFEPREAAVHGIWTRRWSRVLEGAGWGLGTRFRPGAFEPFARTPMAELTDSVVGLPEALGPEGDALERDVRAADDSRERIAAVEAFLRGRLPGADPARELATRIADAMRDAPAGTRVEDLASRHGISTRTLQRLFRRYLGVTPKWVLQRYRHHDAAERIAAGQADDLARLALDLGYFDQAHFIKDFGALVGRTPAQYAEECARAAA